MKRYIIYVNLLFVLWFTACSSKTTHIQAYTSMPVKLDKVKNINLIFQGNPLLLNKIESKIPIKIMGEYFLNIVPSSNTILKITQINTYTTYNSTKSQYIDYGYKRLSKKDKYPTYTKYCKTATYHLVVNLKLIEDNNIFLNKDILETTTQTRCKDNKQAVRQLRTFKDKLLVLNNQQMNISNSNVVIVNNYNTNIFILENNVTKNLTNIQLPYIDDMYDILASQMSIDIINYLTPHIYTYSVALEEKLDIKLTKKDKKEYELLLNLIEKNNTNLIEPKLLNLANKYSTSYAINYNIGVYYEKRNLYQKAETFYQKALEIKPTEEVLKRISNVQHHQQNLMNIQNSIQ